VARNRKRAKERRARRPQPVASRARERATGAPGPLQHAAPDTELARQAELPPDLTEPDLEELEEEVEEEEEGPQGEEEAATFDRGAGSRAGMDVDREAEDGAPEAGAGEVALSGTGVRQPVAVPGNRFINFLRGSWRELQRVQWPDRQQVLQATGVVIGFVIVAGVFLGVADWAAGHLVNFIENGHF
jgi:preprotein translocase SecE subunit